MKRGGVKTKETTMSKKVLFISSSPRKGGNNDRLCDAFAEGAKGAGIEVEKVRIVDLKIGYCMGCYACQKTGQCAIKDDARFPRLLRRQRRVRYGLRRRSV